MATRSTISLKVSESDKGKVFHFDENKLPYNLTCENECIDKVGDVKIEKDYLTIYHHWDGYPEGVGKTLVNKFKNYDSICQYFAWRGEEWNDDYGGVQPKQSDTEPSVTEEYAYLFKDGKWFFKGYEIEEWTDLKKYLETHTDEE